MILTFYGKGKGKTSCALGIALRASGHGKKVLFCQFIKGDWQTGEDLALNKINIKHKKFGIGFVRSQDSMEKMKKHKKTTLEGIAYLEKNAKKYELIVLDEILVAIDLKLTETKKIISLIKANPEPDYILTGRPKNKKINAFSDLVSRIDKTKHPFDLGIKAKQGIDW
jgi:cob(I)alamin adenosyltransferase